MKTYLCPNCKQIRTCEQKENRIDELPLEKRELDFELLDSLERNPLELLHEVKAILSYKQWYEVLTDDNIYHPGRVYLGEAIDRCIEYLQEKQYNDMVTARFGSGAVFSSRVLYDTSKTVATGAGKDGWPVFTHLKVLDVVITPDNKVYRVLGFTKVGTVICQGMNNNGPFVEIKPDGLQRINDK